MSARLRDVKRALKGLGITVEPGSSGSHWKAVGPGGVGMYPIPAHNGLKSDVSDQYLKGLCRAFDLDYDGFKAQL